MHDAQPVLTRLPALPITQGSAHAHHDSRAASLVPSKVPAARRAGLHVAAVPIISLSDGWSLVQSHAVAACRVGARVSCVLLRPVSGGAERRSAHRHENSRGLWVRMHPQSAPVLEEGERTELMQKVKVAFCRSFGRRHVSARRSGRSRRPAARALGRPRGGGEISQIWGCFLAPQNAKKRQKFSRLRRA